MCFDYTNNTPYNDGINGLSVNDVTWKIEFLWERAMVPFYVFHIVKIFFFFFCCCRKKCKFCLVFQCCSCAVNTRFGFSFCLWKHEIMLKYFWFPWTDTFSTCVKLINRHVILLVFVWLFILWWNKQKFCFWKCKNNTTVLKGILINAIAISNAQLLKINYHSQV